jgi:hypothetical protein
MAPAFGAAGQNASADKEKLVRASTTIASKEGVDRGPSIVNSVPATTTNVMGFGTRRLAGAPSLGEREASNHWSHVRERGMWNFNVKC